MAKSIKKMVAKQEYQERVNPGHKKAYVQPLRPRSTVFKSKKAYDRKGTKKAIAEACSW